MKIKDPHRTACKHEHYTLGCRDCGVIRKDLAVRDNELLPAIDRARNALDALLRQPELLPVSSAIGNELEAALGHVLNAWNIAASPSARRASCRPSTTGTEST